MSLASLRTILAALFAAIVLSFPFHGDFIRIRPIGAFGAFYCGAKVVRAGGNPYRVEPLRSCERALPHYSSYRIDGVVEPVPLPGYALAAFVPLSFLPFKAAFLTFSFLGIAATLAAVVALGHITGLSYITIGAALLFSDLFRNLGFGELPPLIVGALSLAAFFLREQRFWPTALLLGVAFIEPHVALPSLLAVLIAVPAMKRPLLALGTALVALSLMASGTSGIHEYFTSVLPAQAQAELPAGDQCSLSWLLNFLGVGDSGALVLGSISYALSAGLGITGAMILARRFEEPAYLVLFPAAIAMIGGSFIHDIQLSIALPAALLLFAQAPLGRALSFAALLALAMPWSEFNKLIIVAAPLTAAALGASYGGSQRQRAIMAMCSALVVLLVLHGFQSLSPKPFHPVNHLPASIAQAGDATMNASKLWARYVRVSGYGTSSPRSLVEKLPLIGGLLTLGVVGMGSLRVGGERRRLSRNTAA